MSIRKPPVRGIPYKGVSPEPIVIRVKCECLQHFCYKCGFLGHVDRDCELEEIKDAPLQYGPFMRASPAKGRFSRASGENNTHKVNGNPPTGEGPCYKSSTDAANPPRVAHKLQLNPIHVNVASSDTNSRNDQAEAVKSNHKVVSALQDKSLSMPSLEDITPSGSLKPVPATRVPVTQLDSDSVESPSTFTGNSPSIRACKRWKRMNIESNRQRSGLHNLPRGKKRGIFDDMETYELEKKLRLIGVFQQVF